jgi:hypothetical protein
VVGLFIQVCNELRLHVWLWYDVVLPGLWNILLVPWVRFMFGLGCLFDCGYYGGGLLLQVC